MYKVYCTAVINGEELWIDPVKLDSTEEMVKYVIQKKQFFKEIMVEDEDEYCVLHAVDGKIIFPEELKEL